ncbi:pyocin knob domain-containing protein [Pseudomonas sp. M5A4_2d]
MARQEINLGALPTGMGGDTPRSANVKINAMTQELYDTKVATAELRVMGMMGEARNVGAINANNQPIGTSYGYNGNDSQAAALNWPVLYPGSDGPVWWNIETRGVVGRVTQVAVQAYNHANNGGVVFVRNKHDAGWSGWSRVLRQGTFGLAGRNFFTGNIDQLGNPTDGGFSTFQLTGETTGTRPAGWSGLHGGLLEAHSWDANTAMQRLFIGGSNYTRFFNGNAWSEWSLIYTSANTFSQVAGGAGLMDNNYIGTWRVVRFQNGFTVLTNSVVPDVELPASGIQHTNIQLPVAFDDYGRVSVDVQCQPSATWDHYGVIAQYASTPSVVTFAIRNGPVAQRFGAIRVCVTGYWKP